MITTRVYCPDIECDSCIKVVSKTLSKIDGINNFNVTKDHINIEYDELKIDKEILKNSIIEKGFRADFNPFTRKSFAERWRDFRENKHKYEVEYKMFEYSLYILTIMVLSQTLVYILFKNSVSNFYIKYGIWMFYLDVFVISIAAAIWHFRSYKTNVTSMLGMMIGMTFGMQSGMMIGAIFGVTNGMFTGSMIGMFIGVILGFYTGKCCGIMGSLQGMMAGMMGGTMGGMIGVMLAVDNIQFFMPFYAVFNILIMIGLSLLLYEDMIEDNPNLIKKPLNFNKFLLYTTLAVLFLILVIIYGPKSGIALI